jgi:hypothetical protein
MKVLTATSDTQGWRDNDFCWTVEGELVLLAPIECGRAGATSCPKKASVHVRARLAPLFRQGIVLCALRVTRARHIPL